MAFQSQAFCRHYYQALSAARHPRPASASDCVELVARRVISFYLRLFLGYVVLKGNIDISHSSFLAAACLFALHRSLAVFPRPPRHISSHFYADVSPLLPVFLSRLLLLSFSPLFCSCFGCPPPFPPHQHVPRPASANIKHY